MSTPQTAPSEHFLDFDRILRDAYVAGDKDALLTIAGTLALFADERALELATIKLRERGNT